MERRPTKNQQQQYKSAGAYWLGLKFFQESVFHSVLEPLKNKQLTLVCKGQTKKPRKFKVFP